jgi:hypothetical protein
MYRTHDGACNAMLENCMWHVQDERQTLLVVHIVLSWLHIRSWLLCKLLMAKEQLLLKGVPAHSQRDAQHNRIARLTAALTAPGPLQKP